MSAKDSTEHPGILVDGRVQGVSAPPLDGNLTPERVCTQTRQTDNLIDTILLIAGASVVEGFSPVPLSEKIHELERQRTAALRRLAKAEEIVVRLDEQIEEYKQKEVPNVTGTRI